MVDYREVLPDTPPKGAPKEEWVDYMAQAHGEIEDAKTKLLFIADEEGFDVEAKDVETVTDEPPSATFS